MRRDTLDDWEAVRSGLKVIRSEQGTVRMRDERKGKLAVHAAAAVDDLAADIGGEVAREE